MPKGTTAKPKGSTAKPSGPLNNSDSRRSKDHTAKPMGSTAKPLGTLKNSDSRSTKSYSPKNLAKISDNHKNPNDERKGHKEIRQRSAIPTPCRRPAWSDARGKKKGDWEGHREREKQTTQHKQQHLDNHKEQNPSDDTIDYCTKYDRNVSIKICMATKPASASWGTPPRGEPGEPRPLGLRTLSSQQRGANSLNPMQRLRNHSRGFRSQEKVNQRKHKAKTNQRIARTRTREYRTSTPLETRHSLARCVSNYLYDDDHRAFKGSYNQRNSKDRHHTGHKITLLNICFGQDIEDKNKIAPREHRPKWEYADKLKVATLNVRGMKEFAKENKSFKK